MPSPKIYIMYNTSSKLQLRAYIYQGRDLTPMDQDNFSGLLETNHVVEDNHNYKII